jgi:hypothetical protein
VTYSAFWGEERRIQGILGKPEGKSPLGTPRLRSENNNKIVLQEVGCWGMDGVDLAQVRDRWLAVVNG